MYRRSAEHVLIIKTPGGRSAWTLIAGELARQMPHGSLGNIIAARNMTKADQRVLFLLQYMAEPYAD